MLSMRRRVKLPADSQREQYTSTGRIKQRKLMRELDCSRNIRKLSLILSSTCMAEQACRTEVRFESNRLQNLIFPHWTWGGFEVYERDIFIFNLRYFSILFPTTNINWMEDFFWLLFVLFFFFCSIFLLCIEFAVPFAFWSECDFCSCFMILGRAAGWPDEYVTGYACLLSHSVSHWLQWCISLFILSYFSLNDNLIYFQ